MSRSRIALAERQGLDEVVAQGIREKILSGVLVGGDHLVEADFAQEFGVSNGTVRAGFRYLENEGLVELRPRRGMFVTGLSATDALELCSLRNNLEALAAELASQNATPDDAASLLRIMADMRRAVDERNRLKCMESDLNFHRQIVSMSKHKRLNQMYGLLEAQIRLFMSLTDKMHADIFADMIPLHEPIANAILLGDTRTAVALSATHNNADGKALATYAMETENRSSTNVGM